MHRPLATRRPVRETPGGVVRAVDETRRTCATRPSRRASIALTAALGAVALLAVGVAMLGAYALVADTLRRRRTELVLRRLHSAGARAIVRQVAAEFALPLALAGVVALPLAAALRAGYLNGFVERVAAAPGLLLLAAASVAIVAAVAFAALHHLRLALALQPVEALR
jgi:putative ABC transport system permease protein